MGKKKRKKSERKKEVVGLWKRNSKKGNMKSKLMQN